MVDGVAFERAGSTWLKRRTNTRAGNRHSSLTASVHSANAFLSDYEDLARTAIHAPPQSADWIRAWCCEVNPDMVIAVLNDENSPIFALPLEIVRSGPARIARFAGGSHANGNFAPGTPAFLKNVLTADLHTLIHAVRHARPDIDLLSLNRQLDRFKDYRNPLLLLGGEPSPNVALAVDLEGGFEALLGRASGKRKRKKVRSQTRKFEAAGGFRIIEARSADEISLLFNAFVEMKASQFRKMGLMNVFADQAIQSFFRSLFESQVACSDPRFVLHGLEVDGKVRAVTGSSLDGDRIVCDFAAFTDDDLAQASPGEFLFFHNIKSACEADLKLFDFSVGDEPYKRLWCPMETQQVDMAIPLSAKGHLLGAAMRAEGLVKRAALNSPAVKKVVKGLRARLSAGFGTS